MRVEGVSCTTDQQQPPLSSLTGVAGPGLIILPVLLVGVCVDCCILKKRKKKCG